MTWYSSRMRNTKDGIKPHFPCIHSSSETTSYEDGHKSKYSWDIKRFLKKLNLSKNGAKWWYNNNKEAVF